MKDPIQNRGTSTDPEHNPNPKSKIQNTFNSDTHPSTYAKKPEEDKNQKVSERDATLVSRNAGSLGLIQTRKE